MDENIWHTWSCSLNPIELLVGALVGIITGVFASWVFACILDYLKRKRLDKKYKSLNGTYIRWYKEDKFQANNKIHAKAYLKHYPGENRLDIRVKTLLHDNGTNLNPVQEWTGEIVMDTIRSGTVVWEQTIPDNGNNGFKRIIIRKDQLGVTLVGESGYGFSIERFTEKETHAS